MIKKDPPKIMWPNEVCQELLLRNKEASLMRSGGIPWDECVDSDNAIFLKETLELHDWPTRSLVGHDVTEAAWLIVQHTARDVLFQKKCLQMMQMASKKNEADLTHIAFLEDRIHVIDGEGQIYGSQLTPMDGLLIPFPIKDIDSVDERRARIGLSSLDSYISMMNSDFTFPPTPRSNK